MATVHPNDRLLIIDRKLFRDDLTRFFVGVVEDCEEGVVRMHGYSYHINPYQMGSEKRVDERTRIVSLHGTDLCYVLPRELNIAQVAVTHTTKSVILSDGQAWSLDLTDYMTRA
ncbi:MAG TPA: hypothetical protein VKV28_09375 [Candidatus Binataceae bacterium]|nr:hypothetical protein [Candidatus Binataceae bacterium]